MERRLSEIQFHDDQARRRFADLSRSEGFLFSDDTYLDHETWIRPAFDLLGDVAARAVLDFGCGHGMAGIVLARRGARVTAFDLSHGYVHEAETRARANGAEVGFLRADGERLPFADASFDRIWGNAILHHLDMDRAGAELRRVLKPDGWAVFCEPMGENPLLSLARRRWRYPGKERTPDEQPLRDSDITRLRRHFARVDVQGFQLLSMIRRALPVRWSFLDWCDDMLLRRVPRLQRYCRYVVLRLSVARPE